MKTKARHIVGTVILLLSLGILLWGVWPFAGQTRQAAIAAGEIQLTPDASASPAILEPRRLVIDFPAQVRSGDVGTILLTLEMDTSGQLTATLQGEDAGAPAPVDLPDVYATHRVMAEARLELAGIDYRPEGVLSEALLPGQPVKYLWNVRPGAAGTYRGTVWLHLRFIPLAGGDETRTVLSAQRVTIKAVSLLGLQGSTARILGGLGAVLGCLLGLDGLLAWFWKPARRARMKMG